MNTKNKMDVLKDMTIIVDTREKSNKHILEYLKENHVPYIEEKLDSGDYSFVLPNYPELNMDKKILIERKGSLDEVAGNFTTGRKRFINEFERLHNDQKIHLVLERFTWRKLFNGTYRSKFHPNSYKASLFTWNIRYNCPIWTCERKESPEIIYKIMYYELKEYLNNLEINILK